MFGIKVLKNNYNTNIIYNYKINFMIIIFSLINNILINNMYKYYILINTIFISSC